MNDSLEIYDKSWTIALANGSSGFPGGKSAAVVIGDPGGGNIRIKTRKTLRWANLSGVAVRLTFEDWPDDDGGPAEAVWPFNNYAGGSDIDTQNGSVTIGAGSDFRGKVAGTGRIVIKYTVSALTRTGEVDGAVIPLDPIIVVER